MKLGSQWAISSDLESAIRYAVGCIETRSVVMDQLAARSLAKGRHLVALEFSKQASECRGHAAIIRRALMIWAAADSPKVDL